MKIVLSFIFLCGPASAQTTAKASSTAALYQEDVMEKARKKNYPGGKDESDLKVQSQLPTAQRKVAPTIEEPSEPHSDD